MTTKELLEKLEKKRNDLEKKKPRRRKYINHIKMLIQYLKARIQGKEGITEGLSDYINEITKDTSKIKKFLKT